MARALQLLTFFVAIGIYTLSTFALPQFPPDDDSHEDTDGGDDIYDEDDDKPTRTPIASAMKYKIVRNRPSAVNSNPGVFIKNALWISPKLNKTNTITTNVVNLAEIPKNITENLEMKLNKIDSPLSTSSDIQLTPMEAEVFKALIMARFTNLNRFTNNSSDGTKPFDADKMNNILANLSKSASIQAHKNNVSQQAIGGALSTSVLPPNATRQQMVIEALTTLPGVVIKAIESIECTLFEFCDGIDLPFI